MARHFASPISMTLTPTRESRRSLAACRATPCREHLAGLSAQVQADASLRRGRSAARHIVSRLTFQERLTFAQANERRASVVQQSSDTAERDIREFALAVRAFNELVNYVLFAVLGLAEAHEIIEINEDTGPIRCRRKPRPSGFTLRPLTRGSRSLDTRLRRSS
jgi:hypothetical protein